MVTLAHAIILGIVAVVGLIASPELNLGQVLTNFIRSWDANIYAEIAERGYQITGSTPNYGFWPLWPLTLSLIWAVVHFKIFAGEVLVTLLTAVGIWLSYRVVRFDHSEYVARRTAWMLVVYPAAFVFSLLYSEALFLALSALALLAMKQQRWWLAGVSGFFLSLTRHVGILIFLPLLIEVIQTWRRKGFSLSMLWVLFVPIGAALFPLFVYWRQAGRGRSLTISGWGSHTLFQIR